MVSMRPVSTDPIKDSDASIIVSMYARATPTLPHHTPLGHAAAAAVPTNTFFHTDLGPPSPIVQLLRLAAASSIVVHPIGLTAQLPERSETCNDALSSLLLLALAYLTFIAGCRFLLSAQYLYLRCGEHLTAFADGLAAHAHLHLGHA